MSTPTDEKLNVVIFYDQLPAGDQALALHPTSARALGAADRISVAVRRRGVSSVSFGAARAALAAPLGAFAAA